VDVFIEEYQYKVLALADFHSSHDNTSQANFFALKSEDSMGD
jgi:hypothetical protein